jgi:hypothetical protein
MEPLYEHDCPNCVYHATVHEKDIYTCVGEFGTNVIVRDSSDGPDYSSSPLMGDSDTDLFNGIRIAEISKGTYLTVGISRC